ncbi:metal-binding protein [Chitinophaga caeni]|uniref:Metal-binding protein n=1 Tax=Chitinophaga caeni TaxID=2029983 RepID=A0A291QQ97_9BACT|nr:Ada metal-binding domain-containing protein [Chitinophaga caeni]ATL46130.1 metal-binding protein [Chitinophaga caeni]
MLLHSELGGTRYERAKCLWKLTVDGKIKYAGNKALKIYGSLQCKSGRRMKMTNRVFFADQEEARNAGYRPCGHCMKKDYQQWKLLQR